MSPDAYKYKKLKYKIDNNEFDIQVSTTGMYYFGGNDSDNENEYEDWLKHLEELYDKKTLLMESGEWISKFIENKYINLIKKDCQVNNLDYSRISSVYKVEYV